MIKLMTESDVESTNCGGGVTMTSVMLDATASRFSSFSSKAKLSSSIGMSLFFVVVSGLFLQHKLDFRMEQSPLNRRQ